jgi:hypothetical protein
MSFTILHCTTAATAAMGADKGAEIPDFAGMKRVHRGVASPAGVTTKTPLPYASRYAAGIGRRAARRGDVHRRCVWWALKARYEAIPPTAEPIAATTRNEAAALRGVQGRVDGGNERETDQNAAETYES